MGHHFKRGDGTWFKKMRVYEIGKMRGCLTYHSLCTVQIEILRLTPSLLIPDTREVYTSCTTVSVVVGWGGGVRVGYLLRRVLPSSGRRATSVLTRWGSTLMRQNLRMLRLATQISIRQCSTGPNSSIRFALF